MVHRLSCSAAYGIFRTRARTRVPCIGKWIPNHCATREALEHGHFGASSCPLLMAVNSPQEQESLCHLSRSIWGLMPEVTRDVLQGLLSEAPKASAHTVMLRILVSFQNLKIGRVHAKNSDFCFSASHQAAVTNSSL